MIKIAFLMIIGAGLVDVLIKEFYVKGYLWRKKYNSHWSKLPDFWKDSIPIDRFYRIRYAMVLNAFFMCLSGFLTASFGGSLIYIYLAAINWQHIAYQWICGFLVPGGKLFDLHNAPIWMGALPWNKALARYHGEEKVTSEEIFTVAILGLGFLFLIYFFV